MAAHLESSGHGDGVEKLGWLGLPCQVPRLEVCSWGLEPCLFAGMLMEMRPRCLVFHPGAVDNPCVSLGSTAGWILLSALPFAPSVTQLTIILCKESMGQVSRSTWWLVRRLRGVSSSAVLIMTIACFVGDLLRFTGGVLCFLSPASTFL